MATTFAYPHTGGASTHIDTLIDQLRKHDRDAGVVDGRRTIASRWRRAWTFAGVGLRRDAYHVRMTHRLLDCFTHELHKSLAADASINLIHAHDHRACLAARRAAEACRDRDGRVVRIVQTVHGPWLYEVQQHDHAREGGAMAACIRSAEAASFSAADAIIAVDSGQRDIALEFGAEPSKLHVIYNAVRLDELDRLAKHHSELRPEQPYFVVPRRLVPKTGVGVAIEALAQIPDARRPLLLIAGQGPLRAELESLIDARHVRPWVRLLGPVPRDKLIPLMKVSAGVIVPSVPAAGVVEATSLAAIEAMALGVPIIASAIGGLAEIIEDGRTGLLAPPGDPKALAAALMRAMQPETAAALRDAARAVVEQRLSSEPWFASVAVVYRSAMRVAHNSGPRLESSP